VKPFGTIKTAKFGRHFYLVGDYGRKLHMGERYSGTADRRNLIASAKSPVQGIADRLITVTHDAVSEWWR
jgi:hypothetical protein